MKCSGCGEPWPCSDSKRTDINGRERAKHFVDERKKVRVRNLKSGEVKYSGRLVFGGPTYFEVQLGDFDSMTFSRTLWEYTEQTQVDPEDEPLADGSAGRLISP